jgi:HlyD family secretion protein
LREEPLKKLLFILPIPLAALAWWALYHRNQPPEVPFAKVKREKLVSTLPTNGKVEPIEWTTVRAETAGAVDRTLVEQGRAIAAGAVLVTLQASGAQADLAAAEARAAQARSELAAISQGGRAQELADIENGLARVRFDRQAAQKDAATLERLAGKQAATQSEVERARDRVRQSDIEIAALERKRAALVASTDRGVAEARLREAEIAAAQARRRIERSSIRSPLAGTVYSFNVRPGSYLNPGDPVASVGRTDRLRVRVYVDEPEVGRVAVGQPVAITWDALPGKTWNGVVEKLPTEIVPLNTRQVGEVLCTIENPGNELVPGTNVNAEIRTNVVENALTIPKEALRRANNQQGVLLLTGDKVEWRPIAGGVSSVTRSQVTSGLNEGDSVALATTDPLKAGDRVTPVYP